MGDSPATRPSLLVRIRTPEDSQAWAQFVDIYAPLVYGFARKHGLQDADAADLTQETLRAVSSAVHRLDYDPKRGTFRGWLFTVVRNKLRNFLAQQKRRSHGTGDPNTQDLLTLQPSREADQEALWEQEYEHRMFAWAAEKVKPMVRESTWKAFWATAVEGKGPKETARALGLTVAAVYLAKSRIMARLKEQIQTVQGEEE